MSKDYYEILGLNRGASPDDIKRAFHKLAHRYHPDKKGGDEMKFKEVNEAYQILSNDKRRAEYDSYGQAFSGASGGGFSGGGQPAWDFGDFAAGGGQGVQFDIGDIFSEFFGGRGRNRVQRGRDISV